MFRTSSHCFATVPSGYPLLKGNSRWTRFLCKASLITDSKSFEVGRFIGSCGFMNISSYSGNISGMDIECSPKDLERLKTQDVGEGSVNIRLYEGRISQGPLRGTSVMFKVYPGQLLGGIEADWMAANELNAHASLQSSSKDICQNLATLAGGFETQTGEQWLAFHENGKFTAADYTKFASERVSKQLASTDNVWNRMQHGEIIKQRRHFITKLLRGAMNGLAFMHNHDRLHQSLGPFSVGLNTMNERDTSFLVSRLRDFAFSVDVSISSIEKDPGNFAGDLWRRATNAGATTPFAKRAFGFADDIYEAGFLLAYLAIVPFCEAGIMDNLSLQRIIESTFQLDLNATREYLLADERFEEAVKFLDLGDQAGWQLLEAMLNPDFRKRPIAEAVLNHRFLTGAVL